MEKAEKDWEEEISERKQTDKYYTEKELFNIIFQNINKLRNEKNRFDRFVKRRNKRII